MAAHPALAEQPDLTGDPAGDDYLRYLDTLRELGEQGAAVNTALLHAHTADTAQQRRAALTALHTRLRGMAATANDALGDWPEPGETP